MKKIVPITTRPKYTQEQLEAAFKKVQNEKHWKDAIDKVIDRPSDEELDLIGQAVIHFTGSVIMVTNSRGNKVRIRAAGYWATIGA